MNILELHKQALNEFLESVNDKERSEIINNKELRKGVIIESLRHLKSRASAGYVMASRLYISEMLEPSPNQDTLDAILADKEVGGIQVLLCIQQQLEQLETGIYDPGMLEYVCEFECPIYPRFPNNTLDLSKLDLSGCKIEDLWLLDVYAYDIGKVHPDTDIFDLNNVDSWFDYPIESLGLYRKLFDHRTKVKVIYPDFTKADIVSVHIYEGDETTFTDGCEYIRYPRPSNKHEELFAMIAQDNVLLIGRPNSGKGKDI